MTSSGTKLTFYSPSLSGWNYIHCRAPLTFSPVWADVGTAASGTGNVLQFAHDRSTSNLPVQFFRLRLTSAP
jgi:hypothetical protein